MTATLRDTNFEDNRETLLGLAYRLTGSFADAEDIVHEVYIKWLHADREQINYPKSWLAKVTTNLALDHLKSARVRREEYVGQWIPEPFIDEHIAPVDDSLMLDQSISLAFMMVLERLSPAERVAFILHDIFSFSFNEIADMTGGTPGACRKQASRARQKVRYQDIDQPVTHREHKQYADAFFSALKQGDVDSLANMLTDDVTLYSDGGGKATAAQKPILGYRAVSEFLRRVVSPSFQEENEHSCVEYVEFNGSPGLLVKERGEPITAFQFYIIEQRVKAIFAHRNPDKLRLFIRH